jgi:endogenous inhibitor of DNA gyrase (YacG/DUF329 family)
MPFCSDRCRSIDLGRWLNEEISVPVNEEEGFDDDDRPQLPEDEDED